MPAISNIVLNDGSADVTFSVKTTDGKVAQFLDRSSGVPLGYSTLQIGVAEPGDVKSPIRHVTTLRRPKTITDVNGQISVPRFNSSKLEWFWNQSSTLQERQEMYNLMKDLLNDTDYESSVVTNSPYY